MNSLDSQAHAEERRKEGSGWSGNEKRKERDNDVQTEFRFGSVDPFLNK